MCGIKKSRPTIIYRRTNTVIPVYTAVFREYINCTQTSTVIAKTAGRTKTFARYTRGRLHRVGSTFSNKAVQQRSSLLYQIAWSVWPTLYTYSVGDVLMCIHTRHYCSVVTSDRYTALFNNPTTYNTTTIITVYCDIASINNNNNSICIAP